MNDPIENKINSWVSQGDSKYLDINQKIIHLEEWLFSDYEPSIGPNSKFFKRLNDWLENLKDETDQKILLEMVTNIFYIGREELNVLYREAYKTKFARWLIDDISINFNTENILTRINEAVLDTWFCPLTDSLRINQFYHINDIPAKNNLRPDWKSLAKFGDPQKINEYIKDQGIKRVVLLEDFIGNGGQVSMPVLFAAENFRNLPILVIPLIICPKGVENSMRLESNHPNVKIKPVITLTEDLFVHENISDIQSDFLKKINLLATSTYAQVSDSTIIDDKVDPYGPFGWRRTGGLIVLHTNTPNNTLPLIHNKSKTWKPLFKRHKRI